MSRVAPTVDTARFTFYDVESLQNLFTVAFYTPAFKDLEPELKIYLLTQPGDPLHEYVLSEGFDRDAAITQILAGNPSYEGDASTVELLHLNDPEQGLFYARDLMATFGVSLRSDIHQAPHKNPSHFYLETITDAHPAYDFAVHPFLMGYNSTNYDLTILSILFRQLSVVFSRTWFEQTIESDAKWQRLRDSDPQQASGYVVDRMREGFVPPSPAAMREYNDEMFSSSFIDSMPSFLTSSKSPIGVEGGWVSDEAVMYRNMLASGRVLDVSKFNEVQTRVGLDRQLAVLGHQIMEFDKLTGDTYLSDVADLVELLAYNASDVIGLRQVFVDPVYAGGFDLKADLLYTYPETVYERDESVFERIVPLVDPSAVRRDRLTIDATSARFVSRVLAPYEALDDIPAVSLQYPHPQIAEELGVESVNVLDFVRDFFHAHVSDPVARAQFQRVYDFYDSLQGRNVNTSLRHISSVLADPDLVAQLRAEDVEWVTSSDGSKQARDLVSWTFSPAIARDRPRRGNAAASLMSANPVNIPYFRKDGSATSGYVTFSTGGIHGAEYNVARLEADNTKIKDFNEALELAKSRFPDPLDFWGHTVTTSAGSVFKHSQLFTSSTTKTKLVAGDSSAGYRDAKPLRSAFVTDSSGRERLDARYVFTSMVAECFHEDFSSYYPNLLRNMRAFYNPQLGEDRYANIFFQKEEFDVLRKDMSLTEEQRHQYDIAREGTKLILNAGSGAGATSYDNPIRMNNAILSMRLIGQLWLWFVAQSKVFAGGLSVSTNTDGVYITGLDEVTNAKILEEVSSHIHVQIEPEVLMLASKDANNRIEADVGGRVVSAGGGSLAGYFAPLLTKTATAPAMTDRVLGQYLLSLIQDPGLGSIVDEFDMGLAGRIWAEQVSQMESTQLLRFVQHVVSSSRGSYRYPFTVVPRADGAVIAEQDLWSHDPRPVQYYNRLFFVKPGTKGAVHLRLAEGAKVSSSSQASRRRRGLPLVPGHHPVAKEVLAAHGVVTSYGLSGVLLPQDRYVRVSKVASVDVDAHVLIVNQDLGSLSPEFVSWLVGSLDVEYYLGLVSEGYQKNWRNVIA